MQAAADKEKKTKEKSTGILKYCERNIMAEIRTLKARYRTERKIENNICMN